jgi:flagellar biosynthesis protein FliR
MAKPRMTREEARRDHEAMLRYMARWFAVGLSIGLCCAALVFLLDIGSLGTRLSRTDNPVIPVFLLAVPMGLTFGAILLCIAIWVLPYEAKYERTDGREPF